MKIRVGETQTKNVPEPHIPDRIERVLHTVRTFPTSFLRIERTWRSFRSAAAAAAAAGCGDDFVGGREGLPVIGTAGGNGRYTHRSLPPPWLSPTRPPMQNHPLSRSMGNYFLSVDYGVNFRTTRPDHFRTRYGSSSGYRRERKSH